MSAAGRRVWEDGTPSTTHLHTGKNTAKISKVSACRRPGLILGCRGELGNTIFGYAENGLTFSVIEMTLTEGPSLQSAGLEAGTES